VREKTLAGPSAQTLPAGDGAPMDLRHVDVLHRLALGLSRQAAKSIFSFGGRNAHGKNLTEMAILAIRCTA
jgi:hypothetical protein